MPTPHKNSNALPPPAPQFPPAALLWCLWAILALTAVWRVMLSLNVLVQPTLATGMGAVVVHWRRLDQFVPWIALLLLTLGGHLSGTALRRQRTARLLTILFAIGIALTALSIVWDEFALPESLSPPIAWGADIALALAAIATAGRQFTLLIRALYATPSATTPTGVTLLDLWRFLAAQWALLMVAAMLYLRATLPTGGLLDTERIRSLIFLLPAAAILPQAMMIAGISWSSDLLLAGARTNPALAEPRLRAWILSFVCINLAAFLMVVPFQALAIPGSIFALFAIVMYLVGFPPQTWRTLGGKIVLFSWFLLALAWMFLLLERTLLVNAQISTAYYGGAWRHLWATGALVLWLLGMGTLATERLLPAAQPRRAIQLAVILMIAGVVLTSTLLFITSLQQGESQVPILRALPLGTLPELAAIVIAGAALLRSMRLQR